VVLGRSPRYGDGDEAGGRPAGRRGRWQPPARIAALAGAEQIALEWDRGCARLAGGEVRCFVAAGPDPLSVQSVEALRGARLLSVRGGEVCTTIADGPVSCVGLDATSAAATTALRTIGPPISGVVSVAHREEHVCAVMEDGRVLCRQGLRDPSALDVPGPRRVELPRGDD
jgi:hypothetical protein